MRGLRRREAANTRKLRPDRKGRVVTALAKFVLGHPYVSDDRTLVFGAYLDEIDLHGWEASLWNCWRLAVKITLDQEPEDRRNEGTQGDCQSRMLHSGVADGGEGEGHGKRPTNQGDDEGWPGHTS